MNMNLLPGGTPIFDWTISVSNCILETQQISGHMAPVCSGGLSNTVSVELLQSNPNGGSYYAIHYVSFCYFYVNWAYNIACWDSASDSDTYWIFVPICTPGHYSDPSSVYVVCNLCPPGTATNNWAQVPSCPQCAPGSYASSSGMTSCTQCPPGTYSNSGLTGCVQCPSGTFNPSYGASSSAFCLACPVGTYSANGASQCTKCPAVPVLFPAPQNATEATGQPSPHPMIKSSSIL